MSKLFRGIFVQRLDRDYQRGCLEWEAKSWQAMKDLWYARNFNVYSKISFGGAKQIIGDLARYTHRVAITNRRIRSVSADQVRFHYRDYRDGKRKEMDLDPIEFCRRFLQHVLPKGLAKIRHYGILSNRQRNRTIPEILFFFSRRPPKQQVFQVKEDLQQTYGTNLNKCPLCKRGELQPIGRLFWVPIRGDPNRIQFVIQIVPYSQ